MNEKSRQGYIDSITKTIYTLEMISSRSCGTFMCSQCPFNMPNTVGCFVSKLIDLIDECPVLRLSLLEMRKQPKHVKHKENHNEADNS